MWMLLLSVHHGSQIGVRSMCFWSRQELMGGHCRINVMMMLLLLLMMIMMVMLLVSAWTKTP
jgi:hypothetical protein